MSSTNGNCAGSGAYSAGGGAAAAAIPLALVMPEHDPAAAARRSAVAVLSVEVVSRKCSATRVRAGYPLKLLVPPTLASFSPRSRLGAPAPADDGSWEAEAAAAAAAAGSGRPAPIWAFLVGFGGGLVAGDLVALSCEVGPGAAAVLTTQATTKVYHARGRSSELTGFKSSGPEGTAARLVADPNRAAADQQPAVFSLVATVADGGLLALVPASVALFEDSRFRQAQRVALAPGGSFVCLDVITSGRVARGETWAMCKYQSLLQVTRQSPETGESLLLLSEALLLEPLPGLSIAERMGRVHVYGTLVLTGPRVAAAAEALLRDLSGFTRGCFQRSRNDTAAPFFFAAGSPISGGCVVRFAAENGEAASAWCGEPPRKLCLRVRAALSPIEGELGGSPFLL